MTESFFQNLAALGNYDRVPSEKKHQNLENFRKKLVDRYKKKLTFFLKKAALSLPRNHFKV